jgi:hypothetical protein
MVVNNMCAEDHQLYCSLEDNLEYSLQAAKELTDLIIMRKRARSVPIPSIISAEKALLVPVEASFAPRPKKRRTAPKKTVSFSEKPTVIEINIPVDEFSTRWYIEEDYQRIKQENRNTLIKLSQVNGKLGTMDASEFCIRGLEVHINVLLLQIPADRQKKVVESVLATQTGLRSDCKNGKKPLCQLEFATALRESSRNISKLDKLKAWRTATIDAL